MTQPEKRYNGPFRPNLTINAARLAMGVFQMITIFYSSKFSYPGARRSLPFRSNISSNIRLVTTTSASWNTRLLAWRKSHPPMAFRELGNNPDSFFVIAHGEAVDWKLDPQQLTSERFRSVPARVRMSIARFLGARVEDVFLSNGSSYGLISAITLSSPNRAKSSGSTT